MNSGPHVRPPRSASTSLLVDVAAIASRARAIVRRARRPTPRHRASERPPARLPGAAARLPRPLEVAFREASEPPTYTFAAGVRIYGLSPPPGRAPGGAGRPGARVDESAPPPGHADAPFVADACWDVPER